MNSTDLTDAPVLVCGGTGFIGRNLVTRLRYLKKKVIVASRKASGPDHVTVDLEDRASVKSMLEYGPFCAVYNCAGVIDQRIAADQYTSLTHRLLNPALNLAEIIFETSPQTRLVHVGTNAEYGNAPVPHGPETRCAPNSAYGAIKLAITECLLAKQRSEGLNAVIVRPFFVYGPGAPPTNFLEVLLSAAKRGDRFPTSPGLQTRDWVHVDLVVDELVRAIEHNVFPGTIINACSGIEVPVKEIIGMVSQACPAFRPEIGGIPYRATELMRSVGVSSWPVDAIGVLYAYIKSRVEFN